MRTFIAKSKKTGLKITFKYDYNTILRQLEFEGDWTNELINKILPKIPVNLQMMLSDIAQQKPNSPWRFSEVQDLSFESFYRQYPNKVGPKEKTRKAYEKLSEADKMEAILYIPELIKLKKDGTAYPYPATYLNQKYWK